MKDTSKKMDLKKQLLAAIAMLVVSAVALSSATYAWFVNNDSVEAKGMSVNAVADSSLLIKGGDENEVFGSVGTTTITNNELKPCTSADGKTFARLGDDVVVAKASASDATFTGDNGQPKSGELVTIDTDATTYYVSAAYTMKYLGDNDANVYVSSITLGGTAADIDKAIRVSVTVGETTYVYNAGGGTNLTKGVGTYSTSTSSWSLAPVTYTAKGATNPSYFSLTKNTETAVSIKVWYEGQDTLCYTDKASTNGKTISVVFNKAA